MEKIRFLKSVHGSYGEANPGDEKEVTKTLAHELVMNGIAEKVEGASEGEKTESEQKENGGSSEPKPITSDSVAGEAKTDEPAGEAAEGDDASEDADTPAERRARRRRAD